MTTFIVPIDFTEESIKGAETGARIAAQVRDARLILYNVYASITASTDGSPLADDTGARRKVTEIAFQNVRSQLLAQQPSVNIEYWEEEGDSLVDNLEKFAGTQQADFIIMNVSEASAVQHFIFGSNAVEVAKRAICPVIILPPNAGFKGVKKVLFASDLKDVAGSTPIDSIRKVLSLFDSTVHVLHVAAGVEREADELQQQKSALHEMLITYRPEFYLLDQTDFLQAVEQIVQEQDIDLILTVPRTHGFFSNLFSANHTKKLAYQGTVPVIAIHE
ncbi:MAG: universal stress protein [Williamsia sp.]|nr:universal stress protein [Williamsia sp.]